MDREGERVVERKKGREGCCLSGRDLGSPGLICTALGGQEGMCVCECECACVCMCVCVSVCDCVCSSVCVCVW